MPGRISYNGIHIDFQNEWAKFNPNLISDSVPKQSRSGIVEVNKFFEQEIISTQMRFAPGQDEIQLQRFLEYANDGSTFELWRDRNLGAYISFEGGGNSATVPTITPRGLQTNDKVAGTFTNTAVADAAWYLDPSTGLMTVVPTINHIPRFEAGKYGQHAIRIDGAAANLITHPSAFDNAAWTKSGSMSVNADTGETLDPAGASAADELVSAGSNQSVLFASGTAVGNNAATACWVKCSSGTQSFDLGIQGSGSGTGSSTLTATTEWRRFSHPEDTSGFAGNLQPFIILPSSGNQIYVWGAVLYDSAQFDFGTVGALSTAAKTKGADKLTFASANIINRDKGTVLMRFKPSWGPSNLGTNFALFQSGADATNRHLSIVQLSNNTLEVRLYKINGSTTVEAAPSTSDIVQDAFNDLVVTYDVTVSNGINVYLTGALMTGGTSSNSAFSVSEVSTLFTIGSLLNGSNPAFSVFDEILIMKDVKSAAWIQQMASRTQAIGEGRNYWSSVRLANLNYVRQALRGGRSTIPLEFEEVLS